MLPKTEAFHVCLLDSSMKPKKGSSGNLWRLTNGPERGQHSKGIHRIARGGRGVTARNPSSRWLKEQIAKDAMDAKGAKDTLSQHHLPSG